MPIYLRHRSVWLRIKEIYTIHSSRRSSKRGSKRKRQAGTTPYGMVAECVEPPRVGDGMPSAELKVPASKVTKFMTRLHKALGDSEVIVLVEPRGEYYYRVRIYAPNASSLEEAVEEARKIIEALRARKRS